MLVLEGTASDLSAALCCGLVRYLLPPSWYESAYCLIEVSVVSGSLDRSTSTFKPFSIDVVATNSPPSVPWRNVLHSSNSSISSPAAMATVNEYATVVLGSELVFVDRNNTTLGSEVFIEPHRTVIQHSLQIQDVDASSGDMSISLSVLFRTISIERNILNEGDISTQTYQFPHGLINESVSINFGEIIGPGDFLQITGDIWDS